MKNLGKLLRYTVLVIAAVICLFPILWITATAFKTRTDAFAIPPVWFFHPTLDAFRAIFAQYHYQKYFLNSIIIVGVSSALSMVLGVMAAYVFARFKFRGRDDLLFWILSTRMFPPIAGVLPYYLIMARLGLLDTRTGLIISYLTFGLPVVVWMMRGFFVDIPRELDEAAMVDGYSRWGALWKVIMPISLPGIVATLTFVLMLCWNEFLYAVTLTGTETKTMPIAVSTFYTDRGIMWDRMAAAGLLAIVPIVVFSIVIRKYIIRGLSMGAVKG